VVVKVTAEVGEVGIVTVGGVPPADVEITVEGAGLVVVKVVGVGAVGMVVVGVGEVVVEVDRPRAR